MYCPNCGAEMPEDSLFCASCGTRIAESPAPQYAEPPQAPYVPNPAPAQQAPYVPEQAPYTPAQQAPYTPAQQAPYTPAQQAPYTPAQQAPYAPEQTPYTPAQQAPYDPDSRFDGSAVPGEQPAAPKKKKSKGALIGIIAGAAAVALLLVAMFVWPGFLKSGGSKKKDAKQYTGVLYVKDYEVRYNSLAGKESVDISESLSRKSSDSAVCLLNRYWYRKDIQRTEDGKIVFYPDKCDLDDDEFTLYYRRTDKADFEPVKIMSDVDSYEMKEDGSGALIESDGKLYLYLCKDDSKTVVAKDVKAFRNNDDFTKFAYVDKDGKLYIKDIKSDEKTKVANDVEYILDFDGKTVTYQTDAEDDVYNICRGSSTEDRKTLLENISDDYLDGDLTGYYLVPGKDASRRYSDYVIDEKAGEPDRDYPSWSDPDYDAHYEEYNSWRNRSQIREYLEDEGWGEMSVSTCSVYWFDGKTGTLVSENVSSSSFQTMNGGSAAVFDLTDLSGIEKVNLSDYESFWDLRDAIDAQISENSQAIAIGTVLSTGFDAYDFIRFNSDNTKVMFAIENKAEEKAPAEAEDDEFEYDFEYDYDSYDYDSVTTYALYEAAVSKGKVGASKLYAEEAGYVGDYQESGTYLYAADYDTEHYCWTLYYGGKEIAQEVAGDRSSVGAYEIDGKLYYGTDYDTEYETFTAYVWSGGKSEKIADDITDYKFDKDNSVIYYSKDADEDGEVFTLYRYEGGKATKIADEVYNYIFDSENDAVLYFKDYYDYTATMFLWSGGKSEKIADDVNDYLVYGKNKLVVLAGFDTDDREGSLIYWNNGKTTRIDSEVNAIIH